MGLGTEEAVGPEWEHALSRGPIRGPLTLHAHISSLELYHPTGEGPSPPHPLRISQEESPGHTPDWGIPGGHHSPLRPPPDVRPGPKSKRGGEPKTRPGCSQAGLGDRQGEWATGDDMPPWLLWR